MKQRKTMLMNTAIIVAAFLARVIQIFLTIDFKTGFYKTQFSALGLGLTIFTTILCGSVALLARNTLDIIDNGWVVSKATSIFSGVLSISLFYELFSEKFFAQGAAWQVVLMKLIGFLAAVYFLSFALFRVLNIKMPDIAHAIPAFYMIVRIICSFINISSLSLIAENIFLLASYCCMLLFFVSYAAFYCVEDQNIVSLYTRASLAFAFGFCTALPNIIANTFAKSGYTHVPVHSQVVLMFMSLFIAGFVYEKFFKAEKQ